MPHEIVSFDEPKLQEYLGELVRKTVEDALNALLDAEADQIANAGRYERTDERQAYRVFANVGVDGTLSRFSTLRSWAC